MRMMLIGSAFMAISSAFLLYGLNYETRLIQSATHERERSIESIKNDIAVLKAERAHLARPDRIAPLARELGLQPVRDAQIQTGTSKRRADISSEITTGSTIID